MPWSAAFETRRILSWPWIRLQFALHGISWGKGWRIWGMPRIQRFRGSNILLGDGIQLRSWPSTNPLVPNHRIVLATRSSKALIRIGNSCGLTGTTIVAMERIEIGNRVLIGSNVTIVDTDFHPLDPVVRHFEILGGQHSPVVIEDDVFIGTGSLILKGVSIGSSAVIGAGSVVTNNVPQSVVAAGNPARVVRRIDQEKAI